MKQSIYKCLLLLSLLFLLQSSRLSANPFENNQGKEKEMEASTELLDLMGLEVCENGEDEECLKRRIMSEAHLDYIYTQHLKP
ncbi:PHYTOSULFOKINE 3 PRECURSOR [Euphorbia peplus]|nr:PHYTOSULFOKINE 3 PRECURSOR [Euphorbia peplus]